MAILLLQGTTLDTPPPKRPHNKLFILVLGSLYLFFFPILAWFDNGTGLERYSNIITWLILLSLIFIGIIHVCRRKSLRYSKLTCGLSICCILLSLPLFEFDTNLVNILPRLSAVWLGLLFFLTLQQFSFSNKHKQRLLWFIVLSSLIAASFTYVKIIISHFHPSPIINSHIWGAFPNYHTFSIFLISGILSSGYLLTRQIKKYQLKFSPTILLYITPVISLPLILFVCSPTIWSILLIGFCTILKYCFKQFTTKQLVGWFLSLCLGAVFGVLLFYLSLISSNKVTPSFDHSVMLHSFVQTSDMFIERPFTGYGYGKFPQEYVLYSARQHALNPDLFPSAIPQLTSAHSEILTWGIEGGLIPVLTIVLSALFVLFRGYFAKKGARLATFSLLFPIVLGSVMSDILYQTHLLWITFIILLYWLDQRVTRYRLMYLSKWKIKTIQFIGLPLNIIFGAVLITLAYNHYYYNQYQQTKEKSNLSKLITPILYKDDILIENITYLLSKPTLSKKLNDNLPNLLRLIKQAPTPEYYHLLISCYKTLGEINKEHQTHLEAQYLFPLDFPTITLNDSRKNK